jgi:hypothetical protein
MHGYGCQKIKGERCNPLVSVHLRRGDLLHGSPKEQIHWISTRGSPNLVYSNLMKQILHPLRGRGLVARVTMHVELDYGNLSHVIDLDGSYTDFTAVVDQSAGEEMFLGPKSTLVALENICRSHVLIGSSSGFSHLLAVLCERTVVIALPMFAFSYDYLPNVISAHEVPGQTIKFSKFNTQFSFPIYFVDEKKLERILYRFGIM